MNSRAIIFEAPRQVAVREDDLPPPPAGQVEVRTLASLVSPGSELLIYRGEAPQGMAVDLRLPAFAGMRVHFPLKYGYSCIGEVTAVGAAGDEGWLGRTVFSFHPHESHFSAQPGELIPLPDGIPVEDALFLPMVETAVTLVQDGAPLLGESALVVGLGIVGLLTTALLARMPLGSLYTFEPFAMRRELSLMLGATTAFDTAVFGDPSALRTQLDEGVDISFEVSGSPGGLNEAIELTGQTGRIVIGSWYGSRPASVNLGARFHRSRIRIIASQVSSIDPALSGRWTLERRRRLAWSLLREIKPSRLLSHRFPVEQAVRAYQLLDGSPDTTLTVAFTYAP